MTKRQIADQLEIEANGMQGADPTTGLRGRLYGYTRSLRIEALAEDRDASRVEVVRLRTEIEQLKADVFAARKLTDFWFDECIDRDAAEQAELQQAKGQLGKAEFDLQKVLLAYEQLASERDELGLELKQNEVDRREMEDSLRRAGCLEAKNSLQWCVERLSRAYLEAKAKADVFERPRKVATESAAPLKSVDDRVSGELMLPLGSFLVMLTTGSEVTFRGAIKP